MIRQFVPAEFYVVTKSARSRSGTSTIEKRSKLSLALSNTHVQCVFGPVRSRDTSGGTYGPVCRPCVGVRLHDASSRGV